jgi:hypothetical protein
VDLVSWRARMYGRCRCNGRNRLAWLFADRRGREFLRNLREVERLMCTDC